MFSFSFTKNLSNKVKIFFCSFCFCFCKLSNAQTIVKHYNFVNEKSNQNDTLKLIKSFKVLEQKSTSNSIQIKGDSALQKGFYNQVAVVGKDTYRIKKPFTVHWNWVNKKEWLIKRFDAE